MAADARVIDMSDLKDLEPLSTRINAASDALNSALESIQQKINDLALGVEVWLDADARQELERTIPDLETVGHTRIIRVVELGYGRIGDNWGFLVRVVHCPQEYDGQTWTWTGDSIVMVEPQALLRQARKYRVKAVALIPDLIDELKRSAETVIDAVEQAKKIADSLQ
jgi:hypothetical protein